jgi:CheY-like chemotaxis protein
MTLSALVVCVDESAAEILRGVLKELGIRVESCPDFPRAVIRTAQQRFDVVIVDGQMTDVTWMLKETRLSRLNDATLAVAVVPSQEGIRELFSLGVNFVLYKPVAYDRALSSLRAARAVMRKEKRKKSRAPVHAHATVDYSNVQQEKATLVDLAEDGMSVVFGNKLPPTTKVYFQFKLPGQTSSIRLSGLLVWQDWNGRGGVQFVDVPKTSRRLLDDFLKSNLPDENKQEFDDVTVEVEDPVPVATLSVNEQSHGSSANIDRGVYQASAPAPSVTDSDANNRRVQARYACRIGAEVYLTGTSVPNHCCLTDLSSGGCYLEVSLPFPQGSSVEILVRTYEMKLYLRGTVQSSHPSFGMGIIFELKTKEQQLNVRKLTDFVAAQSN